VVTVNQNFDSTGVRWHQNNIPLMKKMPQEQVQCGNFKCAVRPRLYRTNTSDAKAIWNSYGVQENPFTKAAKQLNAMSSEELGKLLSSVTEVDPFITSAVDSLTAEDIHNTPFPSSTPC
jgi:hypothetical protein